MSVTDTTILLIKWLHHFDIDIEDKKAILLMLETEEKELKMLEWFLEIKNPTQRQILNQAREICIDE